MVVYGIPNDRKTRKLIKFTERGNILAQARLVSMGIENNNFPYAVKWLHKIINSQETDMQKWEDVRLNVRFSCMSPIHVCHGGMHHIVKYAEIDTTETAAISKQQSGRLSRVRF